MNKTKQESFQPPPNLPSGKGWKEKMICTIRQTVDLMVASVLIYLKPWLMERKGSILEIGCGAQPYRNFLPHSCAYQGLDWENSEEYFGYSAPDTIYYKGGRFPFVDSSFDNLFHTEVLEHIYDYKLFLSECHRVLKPGGKMFVAIPFQARYHYIPYDYWRFTPAALDKLLINEGFQHITILPRGTDITVVGYKIGSVINRWLFGDAVGKIIGLFSLPCLFLALLIGHISMRCGIGSKDDCLGYVIITSKD